MNIYKIKAEFDKSRYLSSVDIPETWAFGTILIDTPYSHEFLEQCRKRTEPYKYESFIEYRNRKIKTLSDFPPCGSDLLITRKAYEKLSVLISKMGIPVPAICPESELVLFVITKEQQAVDFKHSEFEYSVVNKGQIIGIKKFVLSKAKLDGSVPLFRVPITPRHTQPYCTQAFVDCVQENKLTGFVFEPVEVV